MLPSHSMRSHIALFIAVLVSLLCALLGSLISQHSSQQIRQNVGGDLAEVSFAMVGRLDRDMASRASVLRLLGSQQALLAPNDSREIRRLLDSLQQEMPSMSWIGFTDPQGLVLASSNGVLEGVSIAQRPVYLQGRNGLFIGDVHDAVLLANLLPNPTGEAMKFVDISLPIHGSDGNLVGVLASHLSWAWADEVRRSILAPSQDRHLVEFFVIGQDHSILLGPRATIGQKLELPVLGELQPGQSRWRIQRWPDGEEYLTGLTLSQGYQDYPGLGWTVVARQSLEQAYAPAHELRTNILFIGGGLALIFAFLGWLISGYFTRPLQDIASAADRLSAGEATEIPELQGSREVRQLSHSIRHLVESLTQQQTALGVMESLAHHDALTGLPNRIALEKFLPLAQQRSRLLQGCLALLYLDLDGFKPINDTHGHAAGDQLLAEVAQRLRHCLREGDMVARLGGDEFVMVLLVPEQDAQRHAQLVAERTIAALGMPITLEVGQVNIGCSVGGAIWPQDHDNLGNVLQLADLALYQAKHGGRNCARFHQPAADLS